MPIVSNRRWLSTQLGRAGWVAALALAAGFRPAVVHADAAKAAIGAWGVDLAAMDRSVEPGDDFFRYTGGTWLKTAKIPEDRAQWGEFDILSAKSEGDVRAVIEAPAS